MAAGLIAPPIGAGNREIVDAIKRLVLHASDPLTGQTLFPDGTISAPGWAFQGDHDVGAYKHAANWGVLVANGNDVLQWLYDATAGPRVGIGGSFTPTAGLHVQKNEAGGRIARFINAGASSGDGGLTVVVTDNHAATVLAEFLYSTSAVGVKFHGDGGVSIGAAASPGASSLTIDTALGVGIVPTSPLHIEKTKTGGFIAVIKNLGSAAVDDGLRVITTNTAATTDVLNLANATAGSLFRFYADGGAVISGTMASPGPGCFAVGGRDVFLGGDTTLPIRRYSLVVANNATTQLHPTTAGAAAYFVIRDDVGWPALVGSDGSGTPRLIDANATRWTVTSGTASRTNIYFTGGTLTIENKTGAQRTYKITTLMAD